MRWAPMAPDDLGRRLLAMAQRLLDRWDRPLREVERPARRRARPGCRRAAQACAPTVAVHTRFAEIAAAQPDSVAVSWADGS